MAKPKRRPSQVVTNMVQESAKHFAEHNSPDRRVSKTFQDAIDSFNKPEKLESKFKRAKKFKREKPKPDLVEYPNVYKRRVLDDEVIEILPYKSALDARVLHKYMVQLNKKTNFNIHYYDDKEVVAAINRATKPEKKLYQPPVSRKPEKSDKELSNEIRSLLTDLNDATDLTEKKKIRRMLRSRGHTGGLKGK